MTPGNLQSLEGKVWTSYTGVATMFYSRFSENAEEFSRICFTSDLQGMFTTDQQVHATACRMKASLKFNAYFIGFQLFAALLGEYCLLRIFWPDFSTHHVHVFPSARICGICLPLINHPILQPSALLVKVSWIRDVRECMLSLWLSTVSESTSTSCA